MRHRRRYHLGRTHHQHLQLITNAHLYLGGNYNVIATRQFKGKATVDTEANALRMANGDTIPFDAGYCDMWAWTCTYPRLEMPRHPDATAA